MGVFNANDIRGIFDKEWDLATAYRIGYFLPEILDSDIIVVGRDARLTSGQIFDHLCRGINDAGADVIDIGLCDTPAMYFTVGMYGYGGGAMITASHNPAEYNGIKIVRKGPAAIGYKDGIAELEKMVNESKDRDMDKNKKKGRIVFKSIEKDYISFYSEYTKNIGNLKIVVDCSNGSAGVYGRKILTGSNVNAVYINEKPDGRFPGHGPDPMKRENLAQLSEAVKNEKADIGLCFDGDADRVVFIDEIGDPVSPDMIIAILGKFFLKNGKETILYDLRCSNGIAEFISECGGEAVMCPVGHVFLKKKLKETGSAFGGELAGHYYFRDFFFCDSGWMTALLVLSVLSKTDGGEKLSDMVNTIRKYYFSGELNFPVNGGDRESLYSMLKEKYKDGVKNEIDGIRIDYPDWWFVVRRSTNEPLVRLIVETKKENELEGRIKELAGLITTSGSK